MKHKEGWWRQCQAFVGELCKEGWWNACKTVVFFLAVFCIVGVGGLTFIVWLIGGLLTGQWTEPGDGFFGGCFVFFCGVSILCLVVGIPMMLLRWLLRTWVGPVLRRLYFILCFVLPILGFVASCENTLSHQRGFSTWDWEVFWHGTPAEKEAIQQRHETRYMHMTNAEKLKEFVIAIMGGVFGACLSLVPLFIIAALAGALDDEKTDD